MILIASLARHAGALLLALFLLAPLAQAQETVERRVMNDDKAQKVIIEVEDGQRRVTVDGKVLSDAEAEAFLEEWNERDHDGHGEYRLRFGPEGTFKLRGEAPHIARFHNRLSGSGDFFIEREGMPGMEDVFFMDAPEAPMGMMAGFGSMKERAEIARMDRESMKLARQAREAEGAERTRLEAELREKLAEIFERKQELRAERIEALREQLRSLEAEQSERAAAQGEIIERRLKTLLGDRDKYDW